jgi:hypothetical protein
MHCPDHPGTFTPAEGCWWCRVEYEATDQAAGLARVREQIHPPDHPPPAPTLAELELDAGLDPPMSHAEDELEDET